MDIQNSLKDSIQEDSIKKIKIITTDFLVLCDNNFTIIEDGAIIFDERIIDFGKKEIILEKYIKNCHQNLSQSSQPLLIEGGKNSVLMPGLINSHVHLEFSSNKTTLKYGKFTNWLQSVIDNRDKLLAGCTPEIIDFEIEKMLKSGTTSFGNISSNGLDLYSCKNAIQRVVYFNELLGSRGDIADILFANFNSRLEESLAQKDDKFIPAVSIHSPYSTHMAVAKKGLRLAFEKNLKVTTHFMESSEEKMWLKNGSGEFLEILSKFSPNPKPLYGNGEYLDLFKFAKDGGLGDLSFVHCVYANDEELLKIGSMGASIVHCPTSNRLLGGEILNLEKLKNLGINFSLGTDGLSSNNSLNLWDEMRNGLFFHSDEQANELAKMLILSATNLGAKTLGLECGIIEKEKFADFALIKLPHFVENMDDLALNLILHTKNCDKVFIGGESV